MLMKSLGAQLMRVQRGIQRKLALALVLPLLSCTSGLNGSPEVNGIVITQANKLYVSMLEANKIGLGEDFQINLKTIDPDFTNPTIMLPLTDIIAPLINSPVPIQIILPKTVLTTTGPLLVTIDIPTLNTQLQDFLFPGDTVATPGIASTIAYNLLKFYSGRNLNQYSSQDFSSIKALIQAKVDQLLSESEYLSLSGTPYSRLIRYFTNALAFNPTFLTAIQSYGINYTYTTVTPSGLTCAQVPEYNPSNPNDPHCLDHYQYASNFQVNGQNAANPPFSQTNTPPIILAGSAIPNTGSGISVLEGNTVSVSAQSFDLDDDFMDKNMIIEYVPRVLPTLIYGVAPVLVNPEPTPEYTVLTNLSAPGGTDHYLSPVIQYNEALDNTEPAYTGGQTANRNIYYMISDGMVRIPNFWGFAYADAKRPPQFVLNSTGGINQTDLDVPLETYSGDPVATPTPAWQVHASHCETSSTDSTQFVHSKSDGPWYCVFKVFDPDLDADPNAAPDQFSYTLTSNTSAFSLISINDYPDWPPNGAATPAQTLTHPFLVGMNNIPATPAFNTTLSSCTTPDGVVHQRCGMAKYAVTIDNGVKVSAETQQNLTFTFSPLVFDRQTQAGLSTSHSVSRIVDFKPNPARLVNFSNLSPLSPTPGIYDTAVGNNQLYARQDIFLSEFLPIADPTNVNSYDNLGFSASMVGTANRSAVFFAGTENPISQYITQPRSVVGNNFSTGTAGTITFLGNSFTTYDSSYYGAPREFDSTCQLDVNNNGTDASTGHPWSGHLWDQRSPLKTLVGFAAPTPHNSAQTGGWTFEIDAIDIDNLGLRPGEPNDPVYTDFGAAPTDISALINNNGSGLQFCWFNQPNSDPVNYQNYGVVGTNAAIDADYCNWQAIPPQQMQPIPVFYKVSGVLTKLVYHRLRLKWQPKDQAAIGKTYTDPVGFIENKISPPQLKGNVYNNDTTRTLDQSTIPSPLAILALHNNMQPCVSNVTNPAQYMHQMNQTPPSFKFAVLDENKTLGFNANTSGALAGRYEAEFTLLGTRTLSSLEVAKFIPFIENCSQIDQSAPSIANPTPAPLNNAEPAIWYTRADGVARIRMESTTNPILATGTNPLPFCLRYSYTPLLYNPAVGSPQVYQTIVKVDNYATSPFLLNDASTTGGGNPTNIPFDTTCFSKNIYPLDPDQKSLLLASHCAANVGDILWNNASSKATVIQNQNPSNYGLTLAAGSLLNYKLLPEFYQADVTTNNFDALNALFFSINPIDTFIINPSTSLPTFTGYNGLDVATPLASNFDNWIPSVASSIGPTPAPSVAPNAAPGSTPIPANHYFEVVDWDNQPNFIFTGTPTITSAPPSPTATPAALVQASASNSSRIQVFLKHFSANNASIRFNIQSSDSVDGLSETDIFDVRTFNFTAMATPTPTHLPQLLGNGRADCNTLPPATGSYAAYPSVASLIALAGGGLAPYRTCDFSWAPTAADDGHQFSFNFVVQDNPGANPTPSPNVFGIGGRHPSGNTLSVVPQDSLPLANGPTLGYGVDIESLEENSPPVIATGTGSNFSGTNTNSYSSSGGGAGWTTVFNTSNGEQPLDASGACSVSPPSGVDPIYASLFNCALSVGNGDLLQSTTPTALVEGIQSSFSVNATSNHVTAALKSLYVPSAPTQVLIVDGTLAGKTFTVPSFLTGFSISSGGAPLNGQGSFSFSWQPTDLEANILSNPGGFLIPIVISNHTYTPVAGINPIYTTPAMSTRVWLWARISVVNHAPQVMIVSSTGTETPLSGATLSFQTGLTANCTGAMSTWVNCFKIRLQDNDYARLTASDNNTPNQWTFSSPIAPTGTPFASATPFSTLAPGPSPYQYIYQDLIISASPKTSDLGSYSSATITVIDPGSPSRGSVAIPNALNPTTSLPIIADVNASGNTQVVSFNTVVTGTGVFLAPLASGGASTSHVTAYMQKPFSYPTSLAISRPSEMGANFFMGISKATPLTPVKLTNGGTGIYVNEHYVVKWPDSGISNFNSLAPDRTVSLYAIAMLPSGCGTGAVTPACSSTCKASSPAITLMRYNETTLQIEQCAISANDLTVNSTTANLIVTLMSATVATAANITSTEADRFFSPSSAPGNLSTAVESQFADFEGRCAFCNNTSSVVNAAASGTVLSESSGTDGSLEYDANGYRNIFQFYENTYPNNGTVPANTLVEKRYIDTTPAPTRATNLYAYKDETVVITANLDPATIPSASPYPVYHWYVNGCLKGSGVISSTPSVSYNLVLTSLMGGQNNDCTGEYSITEAGSTSLGKAIVRLTIGSGSESLTNTSDGTSTSYVWNVNVINTDPNLRTDTTIANSAPISLSGQYAGTTSAPFALTITYSNNDYFAYTDYGGSLSVRFRQIAPNGNFTASGLTAGLNLNCGIFPTSPALSMLGIQPSLSDGNLYVSASNVQKPYPTSTGANATYGSSNQTCFTNALNTVTTTKTPVAFGGSSTTPAGYLAFSKYTRSTSASTFYTNANSSYVPATNSSEYFLIDASNAAASFWGTPGMMSMFSSMPVELSTPYTNIVRKNVVTGNNLFSLVGASSNTASGWKGFIIISTLNPTGSALAATETGRIMFGSPSNSPAPAASDCQFEGTPLDATYIASTDTLYVIANVNDGSGNGHFVAINSATSGSPSCQVIDNNPNNRIVNPSLNSSENSGNIGKLFYDQTRGLLYGLATQPLGTASQYFIYDLYGGNIVIRNISSSIFPQTIINSTSLNALYLFDNRRTTSPALYPTLYRIW